MNIKKCNQMIAMAILFVLLGIAQSYALELPVNTITQSTEFIRLQHWQITKDIAPLDSLPNIPDSQWQILDTRTDDEKYSRGNWIIRCDISVADSTSRNKVWGLFPVQLITAYEIYLDGKLIGKNGKIGSSLENETPGDFKFNIPIAHEGLTKGLHTITIRLSNFRNHSVWKWWYGSVLIGEYSSILAKMYNSGYRAFFVTGVLFIAFLFNLFLFATRKNKTEHLLFSIICLLVIFDFQISQAPSFWNFPTTYIHYEYYFYYFNTTLFAVLFPVFFISIFELPKKTIWGVLCINAVLFFFFTNIRNIFPVFSISVLTVSSTLGIWALRLKRQGSLIIVIGLLISWITFLFNAAFEGMATVMVICTTFMVAQQFARKEMAEKEALLKSARLENELLKKSINPHFVLNTLTSIIVWLRKDASAAIKLIEALAAEFRMINQFSSLPQITLKQEIALCRAHLKIMSYRKGAEYQLDLIDVDEDVIIPPMILHTLVENGLTHGYENKTTGLFTLQQIVQPDAVLFMLSNDGEFNPDDSKGSTGFGAKYIKSRLEESYPSRWKFTSGGSAEGWMSIIEIRNK